jgi:hypothetical protein
MCIAVKTANDPPASFGGYQIQNRGTNRGTKWLFNAVNLAFMRVAGYLSIDPSPPIP